MDLLASQARLWSTEFWRCHKCSLSFLRVMEDEIGVLIL